MGTEDFTLPSEIEENDFTLQNEIGQKHQHDYINQRKILFPAKGHFTKEPKESGIELTSLVEMVLCSSGLPGKTVSTTIADMPYAMCSSAASPPSAAAAVRACSKATSPMTVSRAKSFSKVLTPGRFFFFPSIPSSYWEMASRISWSVVGRAFGGEIEEGKEMRGLGRDLRGELGKKMRFLGRKERLGRREGRRSAEDGDGGDFRKAMEG